MKSDEITNYQKTFIVILRVLIGWHFLYEGLVKITNPLWTSAGYLKSAKWIFADMFSAIADNPTLLSIADFLNAWGLTIIGLFLILGLFTRTVSYAGIILLMFYYFAMPPFIGIDYTGAPLEGSYLIVNKNLIEAAALIVVAIIRNGNYLGLDVLLNKVKN